MPELTLVLVHSPLVGPLTWEPTAKRLRQMGYQVLVPSLAGIVGGAPPYYRKLAGRAADAAGTGPVLVAHSGAGALLPAIAEQTQARAAIFVDAILPHPGLSWFDTAARALRV